MLKIEKTTYPLGEILRDAGGDWDCLKAVEDIPFGSLVQKTAEFHCEIATGDDVAGIAIRPNCTRSFCQEKYKNSYQEGENVDIAQDRGVIVVKIEEDPKAWKPDKPLYVKAGKITATSNGAVFARFQEILDLENKIISIWKV